MDIIIEMFHSFMCVIRTLDNLHMEQQQQQLDLGETDFFDYFQPELFASKHSIHFPLPDSGPLMEKVPLNKRLLLV